MFIVQRNKRYKKLKKLFPFFLFSNHEQREFQRARRTMPTKTRQLIAGKRLEAVDVGPAEGSAVELSPVAFPDTIDIIWTEAVAFTGIATEVVAWLPWKARRTIKTATRMEAVLEDIFIFSDFGVSTLKSFNEQTTDFFPHLGRQKLFHFSKWQSLKILLHEKIERTKRLTWWKLSQNFDQLITVKRWRRERKMHVLSRGDDENARFWLVQLLLWRFRRATAGTDRNAIMQAYTCIFCNLIRRRL